MICPNCGKETPNDSQSCVECGAPISRTVAGDTIVPSRSAAATQVTPPGTVPAAGTVVTPPGRPSEAATVAGPVPSAQSDEESHLREATAGKYDIIRRLGSGGMATVYLAREIALAREVAIKVLPRAFARDADFVARFKNEAQVAANLEHPHIVRIYQITEATDLVYFVMSFVSGGSITGRIKSMKTLPVEKIVLWGMETCSALAYGHAHGVIHRDLKPDNIMLDAQDHVVVMDYGIAKAGQGSGLTQTGTVIGTPQYMSPEQARGSQLDARSDIYSLGIVLYQMATGELPFQATDAASLMYQHVHEAPQAPDARNADVPVWLRNIILKCLAKNPEDRFATADELKAALSEKYSPKLTTTPLADRDRKKSIAVGIAAVLVFAAIAGAIWWFGFGGGKKSTGPGVTTQQEGAIPSTGADEAVRDDKAFEQASGMNTRDQYTAYIMLYPEGKHVAEAKAKLAQLDSLAVAAAPAATPGSAVSPEDHQRREEATAAARRASEEAERDRLDDQAYQSAEMVNTTQSYSTYIRNYPAGRHFADAQTKLTALDAAAAAKMKTEAEEAAKRDDQAFQTATKENTKQAYSAYLIAHPNGRHADDARSRIEAFDAREAESEKVRGTLSAMGIRLVKIPSGGFSMGSQKGGGADERPVRTVNLTGFEISATEITQGQYNVVMGKNPAYFKLDDNCPVERVSWKDAVAFCNALSTKAGLEPCYTAAGACDTKKNGFRLPTEAEWEYACRAGAGTEYNLGDGESALDRGAWYQRNGVEKTHPVGQRTANAWGLYDMHGNVWEWTNDWYAKNAYESGGASDPSGPSSGTERVLRGGSYLDTPADSRSSKRRSYSPDKNYTDIGFRIVRR